MCINCNDVYWLCVKAVKCDELWPVSRSIDISGSMLVKYDCVYLVLW